MSLRFRQIHLDFHTSEHIPDVGAEFDAERFARTFKAAGVDSVTLFSRCHHGWIYHDTRFTEARHPNLKRNLLAEQVAALHRHGIRAPIYITVGWDMRVARLHPEYIQINSEGKWIGAGPLQPGWRLLCFNSPYIDFVLEQTAEVLQNFAVDGLFFDIIHQRGCVCPRCLEGMAREGLDPQNPADLAAWNRQVIDRYRERHTALVRKYSPDCTIFYNAGHVGPDVRRTLHTFTHLELESLPTGGWGYDHFPLTARYARTLGLEVLGMTGKFQKSWADFGGFKPLPALEYDCFAALAYGAKCSIGDQLHPSGRLDPATYDLVAPVYHSVAAKSPWCEGAVPVVEAAVVNPEAIGAAEGRVDPSVRGALRLLQEAHIQFDVIDFANDWSRYKLVILPDKIELTEPHAEVARRYLAGGGALIASYRSGLARGGEAYALSELGVQAAGDLPFNPDYLEAGGRLAEGVRQTQHVMYERGLKLVPAAGAERLAEIWQPYFNRSYKHFTSHQHAPAHKPSGDPGAVQFGRTITFAHPVFATYAKHGPEALRLMLLNAVRRLLPERLVESDAPSTAQISLMRQAEPNRLIAHVLHYVPERRYNFDLICERLPLHDVTLRIRAGRAPQRVYLAPEGVPLQSRAGAGGVVEVDLPKVDGHAMVVLE
ncbi:MAG TPA: alpha-amylase family protein [Limnochordia bacterium]|nr:alpha-amylase family protein [Limnochordia bacterium]